MRERLTVALMLAVIGAILCFHFFRKPPAPATGDEAALSTRAPVAPQIAEPTTSANVQATEPPVIQAALPLPPAVKPPPTATPLDAAPAGPLVDGLPPATVLENMRTAIHQYCSRFGGNPIGTNPEITLALNGGNPKQIKFIPADSGLRINADGQLLDPWGTPFFFHQLAANEMEIRSAGPDKVMWTEDDIVTK